MCLKWSYAIELTMLPPRTINHLTKQNPSTRHQKPDGGLNENAPPPQSWACEQLVPSWWHCWGGSVSLGINWDHLEFTQWVVLWLRMWALGFLTLAPCLLVVAFCREGLSPSGAVHGWFAFCRCEKTLRPKAAWEVKGLFRFTVVVHCEGSQIRNSG